MPAPKRFLRLKSYFAHYPQFSLSLAPQIEKPLTLRNSRPAAKLLLEVHPKLLENEHPDWIEPAILECALLWSREKGKILSDNLFFLKLFDLFRRLLPKGTKEVPAEEQPPNPTLEGRSSLARSCESAAEKEVLLQMWLTLRAAYFPDLPELDGFTVAWSKRRHRNTLGSCNTEKKRVWIAGVMGSESARPHLEALLYHEMCHAALGKPRVINGRRRMHGPDFKALEARHPGIAELDKWIRCGGWRTAVHRHNRKQRRRYLPKSESI